MARSDGVVASIARQERMMDIAIVGSARTTISPPFAGGIEMHTHVLAEGLTDRGHNVTVYAADGHGRFDIERLRPVVRHPSDTSRRDLCTHEVAERSEHESYADAVRTLVDSRYDIVHLNTIHYLPFELSASLPGAVTGTLHSLPYPRIADAIRAIVTSAKTMSVA
jgi:glycosyltransferase involved in cell wall biosynthesis